jgi:Ca2+-binding RTX toxin-like protein
VLHSVKRSWVVPMSAAVLALSTAGVAVAQGVTGSPGNDRLRGTNQADTFQAFAGNDRVRAFGGNDSADLGPGNDRAWGGRGNDQLRGEQGADRLFGGPGDDHLEGLAGPDLLVGGRGNDTLQGDVPLVGDKISRDRLWGGPGDDTLRGGDGNDRIHGGRGQDTIAAQGGDDRIFARDGERDVIDCGPGSDRVRADMKDVVDTSCEQVHRR